MGKTKVLSLDGGGSWVSIEARALGEIYGHDTPGEQIICQFDYVIGNSGGAIVLAALCCGYTPGEIAGFYGDPLTIRRMYSPKLFSRAPFVRRFLPRYSSAQKAKALSAILDAKRPGKPGSTIAISDWPAKLGKDVKILITAYDCERRRGAIFRSHPHQPSTSDRKLYSEDITLAQAIHASTNAPLIYFDKAAEVSGRRFWDGAMAGYNNPVLVGVVEALLHHQDRASDVCVLSVGSGSALRPLVSEGAPPPLGAGRASDKKLNSIARVASVIFEDPPNVACLHAHVALGQPAAREGQAITTGALVRLSPLIRPIREGDQWRLPHDLSQSEFRRLIRLDIDAMSSPELALIKKLADLWVSGSVPNQPIQAGADLQSAIGHDTFAEGVAHWKTLCS